MHETTNLLLVITDTSILKYVRLNNMFGVLTFIIKNVIHSYTLITHNFKFLTLYFEWVQKLTLK